VSEDYFDDELPENAVWCDRCQGMGIANCYCGGDQCYCENYGEMECPRCHGEGFYVPTPAQLKREAELRDVLAKASATPNNDLPTGKEARKMTEEQIKHMANRFLGWRLPDTFNPDGGIKFDPIGNKGSPHEYRHVPVGTNLFSYTEAVEMVRHMVADLPTGNDGAKQ
jgi:hypothetical protein